MTTTPPALTPSTLAEALRANQIERWERAAVDLLIWHETWVDILATRPELRGRLVVVDDEDGTAVCARVHWARLRVWALSDEAPPVGTSAVRVLGAACSLAGNTPVRLRDLVADGLGNATKRAVLAAITAAFGDVADDPVWDPETM